MAENPVLLRQEAGVARITLNRPDRLNALTRQLLEELAAVTAEVSADPSVRVICITGSGRGFCAGQDLSERDPRTLTGPFDLDAIQRDLFHPLILTLSTTPKPVIAAVNGIAAGAGAAIALAADVVIAGTGAKFAFSFAKVGLSVDAGLGRALTLACGPARARALLMLSETLTAPEAETLGLIWKVVPDESLAAECDAIAARLAATPRSALAGIKAAVAASHLPLPDYLLTEARLQGAAGAHPDYAEGVLAFLEKRAPRFS